MDLYVLISICMFFALCWRGSIIPMQRICYLIKLSFQLNWPIVHWQMVVSNIYSTLSKINVCESMGICYTKKMEPIKIIDGLSYWCLKVFINENPWKEAFAYASQVQVHTSESTSYWVLILEVWHVVSKGGHIYVCDDANGMARDIHRAFHTIFQE